VGGQRTHGPGEAARVSVSRASVIRGMKRAATQARTASRAAVSSGASAPSQASMSCTRSCCAASLFGRKRIALPPLLLCLFAFIQGTSAIAAQYAAVTHMLRGRT